MNCVNPGPIDTGYVAPDTVEQMASMFPSAVGVNRTPPERAGAALFALVDSCPMAEMVIRKIRGAGEFPQLVSVWRSAVEATHDFLQEEHRAAIEERLATEYFPLVALTVSEIDGVVVGFAGTIDGKLEMLFVDSAFRGQGVGKTLLRRVLLVDGVNSVDVNEQNAQAVGFYERAGFVVTGRSAVDGEGYPYPLLHMALTSAADKT